MKKNDGEKKYADAGEDGLVKNILPYEKPKLVTVLLFADQVLSSCGKVDPGNPLCSATPPNTGTPATS